MSEIEKYRAARSPEWGAIYDALRRYRLSNMADDIGNPCPLVDLLSAEGRSIADGESQMIELADEISLAIGRH